MTAVVGTNCLWSNPCRLQTIATMGLHNYYKIDTNVCASYIASTILYHSIRVPKTIYIHFALLCFCIMGTVWNIYNTVMTLHVCVCTCPHNWCINFHYTVDIIIHKWMCTTVCTFMHVVGGNFDTIQHGEMHSTREAWIKVCTTYSYNKVKFDAGDLAVALGVAQLQHWCYDIRGYDIGMMWKIKDYCKAMT